MKFGLNLQKRKEFLDFNVSACKIKREEFFSLL